MSENELIEDELKDELEEEIDIDEADELEEGDEDLMEDEAVEALPSGTMVMCDDGVERLVITRQEAIDNGDNRYFTGIVCRNGHMVERKVKGYVCVACSRDRQKARKKARINSDPEYKKMLALKRAEKHKTKYAENPDYRQRVLDRAKERRVRNSAAKRLNKVQEEIVAN